MVTLFIEIPFSLFSQSGFLSKSEKAFFGSFPNSFKRDFKIRFTPSSKILSMLFSFFLHRDKSVFCSKHFFLQMLFWGRSRFQLIVELKPLCILNLKLFQSFPNQI